MKDDVTRHENTDDELLPVAGKGSYAAWVAENPGSERRDALPAGERMDREHETHQTTVGGMKLRDASIPPRRREMAGWPYMRRGEDGHMLGTTSSAAPDDWEHAGLPISETPLRALDRADEQPPRGSPSAGSRPAVSAWPERIECGTVQDDAPYGWHPEPGMVLAITSIDDGVFAYRLGAIDAAPQWTAPDMTSHSAPKAHVASATLRRKW